jgi:hypothetical protein
MYIAFMSSDVSFTFDPYKNALLRKTRGVGFDDVISAICGHRVLDVLPNSSAKYSAQYVFVVEIDGYAYQVPFRYVENGIHLITVFPSRKATKRYLGGGDE